MTLTPYLPNYSLTNTFGTDTFLKQNKNPIKTWLQVHHIFTLTYPQVQVRKHFLKTSRQHGKIRRSRIGKVPSFLISIIRLGAQERLLTTATCLYWSLWTTDLICTRLRISILSYFIMSSLFLKLFNWRENEISKSKILTCIVAFILWGRLYMPTVDNILKDISTPISTPYSNRASIAKEMLLKIYHLLHLQTNQVYMYTYKPHQVGKHKRCFIKEFILLKTK